MPNFRVLHVFNGIPTQVRKDDVVQCIFPVVSLGAHKKMGIVKLEGEFVDQYVLDVFQVSLLNW